MSAKTTKKKAAPGVVGQRLFDAIDIIMEVIDELDRRESDVRFNTLSQKLAQPMAAIEKLSTREGADE